jgi:hypothetical protein
MTAPDVVVVRSLGAFGGQRKVTRSRVASVRSGVRSSSQKGARLAKAEVVLKPETGVYRYLELLRAGARVTVFTRGEKPKGTRTNRVAVLTKEAGDWGDWLPKEMRLDVAAFHDGAISSKTLADLLMEDDDLWASVKE